MSRRRSILPSIPPRRRTSPNGPARPLKAEVVFALAVSLVLLAVPLYLFRRPAAMEGKRAEDVVDEADAALVIDSQPRNEEPDPKVRLTEIRTLQCGDGPAPKLPSERCDRLPALEEALGRAILAQADCAPWSEEEQTVSFVLSVDFAEKKLHLWPGQSGSLRRPKANGLLRCVKRDLRAEDWDALPHEHRRYQIGIMATYPPG